MAMLENIPMNSNWNRIEVICEEKENNCDNVEQRRVKCELALYLY